MWRRFRGWLKDHWTELVQVAIDLLKRKFGKQGEPPLPPPV